MNIPQLTLSEMHTKQLFHRLGKLGVKMCVHIEHELSVPLMLVTYSQWVIKKKEHPTLFLAQNNLSNLTTNILSFLFIYLFILIYEKESIASRPSSEFSFLSGPNFLWESVALV